MRSVIGLGVVVAIAGCGRAPGGVPAPAAPRPPESSTVRGTVAIDAGHRAAYRYDFDRNALRQAIVAGDGIIAVTDSGNLLRFDAALAIQHENVAGPPVTAIAGGADGPIYAAHADGGISIVDAASLALAPVAAVTGTPVWIGRRRDGLAVVTVDASGVAFEVHRLASSSLGTPDPHPVVVPRRDGPGVPSAWLIDRADRLWWGVDAGEWGGGAGRIDLATGATEMVDGLNDPVTGLVQHGEAVWIFGGVTHMGYFTSFIAEVRDRTAKVLWHGEGSALAREDKPDPTALELNLPVTHIIDRGDRLAIVVWNEIYDVDPGLKTWKRVGVAKARLRWGRPDAVGAYPAIRSAVATATGDLVLATGRDGLIGVGAGAVSGHAVADQLEVAAVQVAATPRGIVAYTGGDDLPFRFDTDRWTRLDLGSVVGDEVRSAAFVPAGDRPPSLVMSVDDQFGGDVVTARWDEAGFTKVDRSKGVPTHGAFALDDELWAIGSDEIWRRTTTGWKQVGTYQGDVGWTLEPVRAGTGWLVHDPDRRTLWRLAIDAAGKATLAQVAEREKIDDAIAWDGGAVLVATDHGLRTLDPATGKLAATSIPAPKALATRLVRDPDGRLWLGGDGLAVVIDGALHQVPVPALTGRRITDLAADRDTIILGLGGAGAVTLTIE